MDYEASTTSITLNGTSQLDLMANISAEKIESLATYVYFYGLAIIIPVGIICNIFIICIFCCSVVLRRSTTGQFLTILAVADIMVLVGDGLRWLTLKDQLRGTYWSGLDFIDRSAVACKAVYVLRFSSKLMSAWITVAITLERLIAVAVPLHVATISTTRRARIALAVLCAVCLALGAYPIWTIGIGMDTGEPMCEHTSTDANYWPIAIFWIATIAIPNIIIVAFAVVIIVFVYRARNQRNQFYEGREVSVRAVGSAEFSTGVTVETQLTTMLVAICISCLCLQVPYAVTYHMYKQAHDTWSSDDVVLLAKIYAPYKICDMIATANYSVNFFLYCLCGSAFRNQIGYCCRSKRSNATSFTAMSTNRSRIISTRK